MKIPGVNDVDPLFPVGDKVKPPEEKKKDPWTPVPGKPDLWKHEDGRYKYDPPTPVA